MKKRLTAFILCMMVCCMATAQVKIHISGLPDMPYVTDKIENNLSKFFTELQSAYVSNRSLDFSGIIINTTAAQTVKDIWEKSSYFRLPAKEASFYAARMTGKKNLRIMPIPLIFKQGYFGAGQREEYAITVDREGKILDFLKSNFPLSIEGNELTSGAIFEKILFFVEKLATAHSTKNIEFLKKIYSDDVMVITGTSISNSFKSFRLDDNTQYIIKNNFKITIKDKTRYINDLIATFAKNKMVSVQYRDIQIKTHPNSKYQGIYYVYIYQIYNSSTYNDKGYLTLVWDFRQPNNPEILLRTWFDKKFDMSQINLTLPTY
ncbi:MAG: hypothetical protein K6F33_05085 [Bacteroidales bacterium]|nr:hypothetical protein [Bacteroidales bacterium]